jgi:periplasmic protein TonB
MRRSFTLCSVGAHTLVITAALYAQILGDSSLPTPHRPLMFDASSIIQVSVEPPKPRAAPARKTGETVSANAAPVIPPVGVIPETPRNFEPPSAPVGSIVGVGDGPPITNIETVVGRGVPPSPPPEPAAPVRVGSGIRTPVRVVDVAPSYPAIARSAHVQGVVILEAVLDAQGRVESTRVLRSVPLLDQAAIDAVQQWRYTPTLLNGRSVPVIITITVNFTLQDR